MKSAPFLGVITDLLEPVLETSNHILQVMASPASTASFFSSFYAHRGNQRQRLESVSRSDWLQICQEKGFLKGKAKSNNGVLRLFRSEDLLKRRFSIAL